MINIKIAHQFEALVEKKIIEDSAQAVLVHHAKNHDSELTIVIDDDQFIHGLNHSFLGIDAPTDVLSFEANELDPDTGMLYLGDVIISLPRAESQAANAGHPLISEIQLLVIHGVLHLLGYDHDLPEAKSTMWKTQQLLLDKLGVKINQIPEA